MQPDPVNLLNKIDLTIPLVGFYDAPDVSPFEPLVSVGNQRNGTLFKPNTLA